ncbi:hypothetical protein BGZ83_010850 [Gryganskiella cystojenkinii]|nr:hypothetical protein BGZ83_010850 [Gryganskiella cystojenkinii]
MEEKKKSTLGKAFSRTFSRNKDPKTASATVITPSAPVAAAAPVKQTSADLAAPTSTTNNGILSPISIPTPNMTSSISPPHSTVTSPIQQESHHVAHNGNGHNGVVQVAPQSPKVNTMHVRDSTALSNSSSIGSRTGLEGTEGVGADGGLNPADILLNRLVAFRGVVKNLQQYFTEVAAVETGVSKAMHKASGVITVPFKDGQQFLGKGGLQDVCSGIRDSAKTRSDQHASAARFVEETVVKNLRRLKQDIKAKIKALKADTNLYSNRVFKERELTQERIASLAKAIGLFDMAGQHQPDMEKMQSDPYVINLSLKRQLAKQVHEENLFARALKQCQEQVATFESHIIRDVKQILGSFAEYQLTNGTSTSFAQTWGTTDLALNVLQEDSEWNNFLEKHGHRLFPSELVDANPDDLDYPCKDSPYVLPVKTAHMSRQSSVLKNWKDGYFVLTLAGWLHVFDSADLEKDPVPDRSIYIPTAILGPHTEPGQKQHVFSLDGKGKGGLLHRDAQTFTVRANSRDEMLEWWSECSKRAHSTTFQQAGDGSLEAISRSGSIMRSSSMIKPKEPEPQQQHPGPSPPYVAQEHPAAPAVAAAIVHPETTTAPTTAPASPTLERSHTGSTTELTHAEPAPAPAPLAADAPAPAPVPVASS